MPRLSEFVAAAHETIYPEDSLSHISVALRPIILTCAEFDFQCLGINEARHSADERVKHEGISAVWFLLSNAEDEQAAEILSAVATEAMLLDSAKARIQAFRRMFINYTAHLLADAWVCAIMDCVDTDHTLKPCMLDQDYLPIDVGDLDRYFGNVKLLTSLTDQQVRSIFSAYREHQETFIPDELERILQNALIQVAA